MFPNPQFSFIVTFVIASIYLVFIFVGFEALLPIVVYILSLYFIIPNPMLFATILALKFLPVIVLNEASLRNIYEVKEPFIHWSELYPQLQPGDIIEFERKFDYFELLPTSIQPCLEHAARKFTHWGIYASDNTVYHLINSGNGMSVVLADSLRDAHNGKCRINNLEKIVQKHGYLRLPLEDIFRTARSYMTKGEFRYDELTSNCEHFVTFCVYNVPFSTQGDNIYSHCSKQLLIDFIVIFIPYMMVYYIWNVHWITESVNSMYAQNVEVITNIANVLQTFTDFVGQNQNVVNFAVVAISTFLTCLVVWFF